MCQSSLQEKTGFLCALLCHCPKTSLWHLISTSYALNSTFKVWVIHSSRNNFLFFLLSFVFKVNWKVQHTISSAFVLGQNLWRRSTAGKPWLISQTWSMIDLPCGCILRLLTGQFRWLWPTGKWKRSYVLFKASQSLIYNNLKQIFRLSAEELMH